MSDVYLVVDSKTYTCSSTYNGYPHASIVSSDSTSYLDFTETTVSNPALELVVGTSTYIPLQVTTTTGSRESWYEATTDIPVEFNKYTIEQTYWYKSTSYYQWNYRNGSGTNSSWYNTARGSTNINYLTASYYYGKIYSSLTKAGTYSSNANYKYYSLSSYYDTRESLTSSMTSTTYNSTQSYNYGLVRYFGNSTYITKGVTITDYEKLTAFYKQTLSRRCSWQTTTSSCEYSYMLTQSTLTSKVSYRFWNKYQSSYRSYNYSITRVMTTETTSYAGDLHGSSSTSYIVYLLDSCTSSIFTGGTESTTSIVDSTTEIGYSRTFTNTTRSSEYTTTIPILD